MRSAKRVPWIFLALVAGIVAWAVRQRIIAEQEVTTGKATQPSYRQTPFWRIYDRAAEELDRSVGWDKVPTPLGLLTLIELRNNVLQQNLHDTTHEPYTK